MSKPDPKPTDNHNSSPISVASGSGSGSGNGNGNFTSGKVAAKSKCWGCGKKQVKGERPFRKCPICDDMNLVPSLFCSDECYRANWPRHKAFHKEMKIKFTHYKQLSLENAQNLKICEKTLDDHNNNVHNNVHNNNISRQTLSAFEKVMQEGKVYLYKNDFANAKKKLKKALKLNPNSPEIHGHLGSAYFSSGHVAEGLTLIAAGIERWAYACLACQASDDNMFRAGSEERAKNLCGFAHSIVWFIETMKGAMSQEVEYEYEQPDWFRDDLVLLRIIDFAKNVSQLISDKSRRYSKDMPGKEQLQRLMVWHGYILIGYYHDGKGREKGAQPPLDRDLYQLQKAGRCFVKADKIQKEIDANRGKTSRPVFGCMREHYHTIQEAQHIMMSAQVSNLLPKEPYPFYKGCFVMVHGLTSNVNDTGTGTGTATATGTKNMNKKLGKVKSIPKVKTIEDCVETEHRDGDGDGDEELGILVEGFEKPTNLKVENVTVLPLSDREIALVSCLSMKDQWVHLKPIAKKYLARLPDPN